jgi:dihydrofolate reductase
MIRLIAALDVKRGIAGDSGIPWKIPADTAHFRDETSSGLIVMGWRTYTEFAAPLHDRTNFVFARSPETLRRGFRTTGSLAELEAEHPDEDIWVIGGAAVYADTIGQADELVLTQVLADFHCTKFFPPYEDEFTRTQHGADARDGEVDYRFETWQRPGAGPS